MTKTNGFRRWHEAGFTADLLPIIPVGAPLTPGTKVKPIHLGKVPGVLTPAQTWSGLGGKWSDELTATLEDLKRWTKWGASVGLQSRQFPGLDIDVDDAATADAIEALAYDYLGLTSSRTRVGSARRLLIYSGSGLRKVRQEFGDKQAVELLAKGQQYVIEGLHPDGGAYEWLNWHPCEGKDLPPPAIDAALVERFFDALRALLIARGATLGKVAATSAALATGTRKPLSDPSLHAPSAQHVLDLLYVTPPERFNSRDELVQFLAPVKAALGPDRADHWPTVLEWALVYPGAEEDFIAKIWDSITDAAIGWDWLSSAFGAEAAAQADFDDDQQSPDAPDPHNTLESMLSRYVYSIGQDRFYDLTTGDPLTANGFNACNTHVAQYGRSGVQSAAAIFMNTPKARKVATVTYRPGSPAIVQEEVNGTERPAVNLWRPSTLKPADAASDEECRPWLEHVSMLFGEEGAPAREHILNYMAFILQFPGVKINHAPVILSAMHGVGKDTMFVPFVAALGHHNVSTVGPDELFAPFNPWIEKQFIVVNEVMNFHKKEMTNKIKPLLADPPHFLQVNRKNIPQYVIPNIPNVLMYTNYDDAIAIDEEDRRVWVHRCLTDEARGKEYFQPLYNWYAAGGSALVARWLLSRDLKDFSAKDRPAMTEAKQEMIEGGTPAPVRWLSGQFETGSPFHGRKIVAAFELVDHARAAFDAPSSVSDKVRDSHAVSALKRNGFQSTGDKCRLSSGRIVRLWTLGRMDVPGLVERYEADAAAGAARARA